MLTVALGFKGYAQDLPLVCGGDTVRYGVVGGNGTSTFEWIIDEDFGEVVTTYALGDSVDVVWYNTSIGGTQIITVRETSLFGCLGEPYSQPLLVSVPNVSIGPDVAVCFGETFQFFAGGTETNDYLWQDIITTTDYFNASTEGNYWVRTIDSVGCVVSDTAFLTVHDLPAVDLGNDTSLCGDDAYLLLDVAMYGDNYFWEIYDFGTDETETSYNPSITLYTHSTKREVRVEVEDLNGCIGYDTLTVAFCGDIIIPNAFTPNDDGYNDTWRIEYLNKDNFPGLTVDVYNRFGDRVFSSKGYEDEWDGTDGRGKKLPMDRYFYVIDLHNGEVPRVGSVTLIR